MNDETILLHNEGRWFAHLGGNYDHEKAENVTADDRPMTPCADTHKYRHVRWYSVDGDRPRKVRVQWKPRKRTSHYTLKNREAAKALGEGLRPERAEPGDVDYDDELFFRLYEAEVITEEPEDTLLDVSSATVVEATPPPQDGLTWVADLPYALSHRDEYAHLFPGKLVGFRQALADALANEFGDARGFGSMEGVHYRRENEPIKVTRLVPFNPPLYEPRRLKSGRKSTRDKVERKHRLSWEFKASDVVRGENRAEATEQWHALIAQYVAEVAEGTATPCGHCGGSGVA